MVTIVPGKEINIVHSRKGHFSILVNKVEGSVVTGTITKGVARYLSEEDRIEGDSITVDLSLSFIKALTEPPEADEP